MKNVVVVLIGVTALWLASAIDAVAQNSESTSIPDIAGKVMTVNGPVDPEKLGPTLMHEHVLVDLALPWDAPERWELAGRTRPNAATEVALYNAPLGIRNLGEVTLGALNRDNLELNDEATAISEIDYFEKAGGGTIVDVTSRGLQRHPEALQRVSRATGVNIVMGTSWYGGAWYPHGLAEQSITSLANTIVHDLTVGVNGTTIRAGIIGEVGTSAAPLSALESKIIRASGRASRLTGAALTVDASDTAGQQGKILDLLADEGTDLGRVVIGHVAYVPGDKDHLISLLKRGPTIEFDLLGRPQTLTRDRPLDSVVAKGIAELVDAGYARQILLSQDVHSKTSLRAYGGTGYTYILEMFVPYLKGLGVTDPQIHAILVDNPQRMLTFAAPKPAQEGR